MSSEPWAKYKWHVYRVGEDATGLAKFLNDCENREEEVFQVLVLAQEVCVVARTKLGEYSG